MLYVSLPFFLVALSFSIATSFARMWLEFLKKLVPLFVALVFIVFMVLTHRSFGQNPAFLSKLNYLRNQTFENYATYLENLAQKDFSTAKKTVQAQAESASPQQQAALSTVVENRSPLTQEIEFWEAVAKLQPTDRDVLLNLAELYQADKNLIRADEYFTRAKEVDPNYGF